MKRTLWSGLAVGALAGWLAAQAVPAPSNAAPQAQSSNPLPAGTILSIELSKSVDAKKVKVSDKIEATVPADLLLHGKIVLPRDTKIFGHITDVKAHSKESPDSKVGIAFDRMVMKKGGEVPLQVIVQAVGRPLQRVDSQDNLNRTPGGSASTSGGSGMGAPMPSRSQERVGAIPIGAAGSDSESPPPTTMAPLGPTSRGVVGMKGLALNAAGAASVISSQTGNVRLESGTQMILRVE